MRVEGIPNTRWLRKERLYPKDLAFRACSQTIKLAAEPSSERFPATVLTHASISHALISSARETIAADAATLAPSSRTENKQE
ncbi:hypothetical protein BHE74_00046165 [Ensete ventricosum]|nr:hypothetical protein BHE74_00046165 [Ensete ventricosum]RZS19902.1 hypothetical protein BHM03_00052346 [Ensete ventricosum]